MTKPTLGKAWALFYVFQQLTKKEAAPILTQPPFFLCPQKNEKPRMKSFRLLNFEATA